MAKDISGCTHEWWITAQEYSHFSQASNAISETTGYNGHYLGILLAVALSDSLQLTK